MADAASRKRLKEIRSQNGNNVCCECGKLNPQWVLGDKYLNKRLPLIKTRFLTQNRFQ